MNAESSTTKSRFDERADFSARIASLPFIRNHGFARNDTKGAVFRAFPKAFLEMPKKKTVNLRLKNEILCLTFAFREQLRVHGGRLFFDYSEGDVGGWNRLYAQPLTDVIEPLAVIFEKTRTGYLPLYLKQFCCKRRKRPCLFVVCYMLIVDNRTDYT